jgi:triacylglycerol lipase
VTAPRPSQQAKDLGTIVADRAYAIAQQVRHFTTRPSLHQYGEGTLAPVLLLPGVFETWQFLRPIADGLHDLGHPIHLLPELGINRKAIVASALLGEQYLRRHDLHGAILVAHSKGGLIGKQMMMGEEGPTRIAQLIAVCTPFGGSSLARFALAPALRAFSPRNLTVLTLAANLEANSRITSIYPRLDPLIPGGSHLAGATNIEVDLVGHFLPLASRRVLNEIENAIK